jgi:NAD(P)-dependent dehydrogenase (short-subunit alcohol dehydrogenase family)
MTHPLFDLTGRVAVVSGAGGGMGRATAMALAEVGADLILSDINKEAVEDTANYISSLGRKVIPTTLDITSLDDLEKIFALVDGEFGKIDVLANIYGPGSMSQPEDTTIEELQYVINGLVIARFRACQLAGQRMLAAGRGSIINIGSIGGVTSLGRGQAAYGMGMAAVVQLTRELATHWSSRGVRTNAILPAQVLNPGLANRLKEVPQLEETFLRGIPAGRLGQPDDIKGLAIFLASDASSWITGAIIPMDGGNLAKNSGGSYPGMPGIDSNLT